MSEQPTQPRTVKRPGFSGTRLLLALVCSVVSFDAAAQEVPAPASPALNSPLSTGEIPVSGDEVRVTYRDGRVMIGEFVESGEQSVTILISSVSVVIATGEIDTVTVMGSALERYRRMRPAIEDDDVSRLLNLARWLQTQKLYVEGLREVKLALDADPTNDDAWKLHRELESQVEMQKSRSPRDPDEETEQQTEERVRARRDELMENIRRSHEIDLLDERAINLIKVYELDLNDSPRLRIERETVERFLRQYGEHPLVPTTRSGREAFFRKSPEAILDIMFRARARDLYDEVTVIDDPKSVELFRTRVQATWLINNCATSRCHGGPDAGDLWLVNRRKRSDASTYTNLLILERSRLADGRPLIDYARPENSPLLQLGLPAEDSAMPHPPVRGWRPAFRNRRSRGYVHSIEWIQSMYQPRPEYPIEYVPPGQLAREEGEAFEPVER